MKVYKHIYVYSTLFDLITYRHAITGVFYNIGNLDLPELVERVARVDQAAPVVGTDGEGAFI